MSLIFKALQRFGSPETEERGRAPEAPVSKPNAVPLRKMLISPTVAICAAAAIFVIGLVVSQGIQLLPLKVTPEMPVATAASPGKVSASDTQDLQPVGGPAEPETANFDPPSVTAAEKISYRVYPPESVTPSTPVPAEGVEKVRIRYPKSADMQMDLNSSTQGRSAGPDLVAALDADDTLEGMTPVTASISANATRPAVDVQRGRTLGMIHHATAAPTAATPSPDRTVPPSGSAPLRPPQNDDSDPHHRRQAAQATEHLQVAKLARRISGAIQADDHHQTQLLLAKLAGMKGAQNVFVLKLKAYALISQNRLDEARTLLTDVLARDASDVEAGLNMAVVDMKAGRLEGARRRLVRLQQLYPENSHITAYLSQLPRKR